VTSGKGAQKETKLFSSARERERKTQSWEREGAENKENVKCQVQIPIQVPKGILRLGKASLGLVSWRFLVGRRRD
jgi:hypothetical protein